MNCGNFKGVSQIYTDTIYDSCQCSNGATWDGANTKCTCGSSGATWDEVSTCTCPDGADWDNKGSCTCKDGATYSNLKCSCADTATWSSKDKKCVCPVTYTWNPTANSGKGAC